MAKILYITDSTEHGGAEEHLKALAVHFSRRGYDVCVAIPNSKGTENLIREITGEGVKVDAIRMRPLRLASIDILRNVFYFCQYFLRGRPDLVHVVLPWPTRDIWCGMVAVKLLRIKYIVDFQLVPPEIQCPPTQRGILKHLRKILTFLFSRADGLICASEGNKNRLIRFFNLQQDSVRIIYNGIDMERFRRPDQKQAEALRKAFGISPDQIVVTTVARLSIQKGHEYLIQGAKQLVSDSDNVIFLLVGDGDLHHALEGMVEELGLKGKFIFAGYRKEIPEILSFTDIFVLPTLFEGLPHSILEAMAAGRCVVASRVDGVDEIVQDGETGVLVDPGHAEQLAGVLVRLVENKEQREKIGLKGKERVKDLFDIGQMLGQTHKLYHEILSG